MGEHHSWRCKHHLLAHFYFKISHSSDKNSYAISFYFKQTLNYYRYKIKKIVIEDNQIENLTNLSNTGAT